MNKFIPLIGAVALAAVVSLSAVAPAAAQWHRHGYYNGWYGPGPAIGAGILGFAAGAALAGSARANDYYDNGDWSDHVAACQDAYRSYDVRSDTYLGYDNYRHRCAL